MLVIKDSDKPEYNKNSVVTVGTFDGIHLGHKKIIADLIGIEGRLIEARMRHAVAAADERIALAELRCALGLPLFTSTL